MSDNLYADWNDTYSDVKGYRNENQLFTFDQGKDKRGVDI